MRHRINTALICVLFLSCTDPEYSWHVVTENYDDYVFLSAHGDITSNLYVVGGGLGATKNDVPIGGIVLHYNGETWQKLPMEFSNSLWWVWGSPDGTFFFVGENGSIYRHSNNRTIPMVSGTDLNLYGIWGTDSNNIWAVGGTDFQGNIIHYDGNTWIKQHDTNGIMFKIWGTNSNNIWAVGQDGTILYYDGIRWIKQQCDDQTVTFLGIAGSSSQDIYTVGQQSICHYDGQSWRTIDVELPLTSGITGVGANIHGQVFIVGEDGFKIERLNNQSNITWKDHTLSPPTTDLHSIWLSKNKNGLAIGGNFIAPAIPTVKRFGTIGYYGTSVLPFE